MFNLPNLKTFKGVENLVYSEEPISYKMLFNAPSEELDPPSVRCLEAFIKDSECKQLKVSIRKNVYLKYIDSLYGNKDIIFVNPKTEFVLYE